MEFLSEFRLWSLLRKIWGLVVFLRFKSYVNSFWIWTQGLIPQYIHSTVLHAVHVRPLMLADLPHLPNLLPLLLHDMSFSAHCTMYLLFCPMSSLYRSMPLLLPTPPCPARCQFSLAFCPDSPARFQPHPAHCPALLLAILHAYIAFSAQRPS